MGKRDFADYERVVIGNVGVGVDCAVFHFDIHAQAELLDVKFRPVEAKLFADFFGLFFGKMFLGRHRINLLVYLFIGLLVGRQTFACLHLLFGIPSLISGWYKFFWEHLPCYLVKLGVGDSISDFASYYGDSDSMRGFDFDKFFFV